MKTQYAVKRHRKHIEAQITGRVHRGIKSVNVIFCMSVFVLVKCGKLEKVAVVAAVVAAVAVVAMVMFVKKINNFENSERLM